MQVNLTRSAEAEEGGWAGFVTDPQLDGSVDINRGFRAARKLLLDIGSLGLPTSTEYVDTIMPQFVADLVSHALVGARQVRAAPANCTQRRFAACLSRTSEARHAILQHCQP